MDHGINWTRYVVAINGLRLISTGESNGDDDGPMMKLNKAKILNIINCY